MVARDALVAAPQFVASSELLALARAASRSPARWTATSSATPSRPTRPARTTVPGVWVAGNVTDLRAQVISAAAGGLNAGAMINMDLIEEDTAAAVETYRRLSA